MHNGDTKIKEINENVDEAFSDGLTISEITTKYHVRVESCVIILIFKKSSFIITNKYYS